jgi:hypothetical protein
MDGVLGGRWGDKQSQCLSRAHHPIKFFSAQKSFSARTHLYPVHATSRIKLSAGLVGHTSRCCCKIVFDPREIAGEIAAVAARIFCRLTEADAICLPSGDITCPPFARMFDATGGGGIRRPIKRSLKRHLSHHSAAVGEEAGKPHCFQYLARARFVMSRHRPSTRNCGFMCGLGKRTKQVCCESAILLDGNKARTPSPLEERASLHKN